MVALKLARFKQIFPGAAKTDRLDARKILELFHLKDQLPMAKNVLQKVLFTPLENEKLKRLTRRRRELVSEKIRVLSRMQADLQAVCPELLAITNNASNLWFLRFITCQGNLVELARPSQKSILKIPGVRGKYSGIIREWQMNAKFSSEVECVGDMIISDATRVLELMRQIACLDKIIKALCSKSETAMRLSTVPGFGKTSVDELAGEIGTFERFESGGSLAMYLGMCPLTNQFQCGFLC